MTELQKEKSMKITPDSEEADCPVKLKKEDIVDYHQSQPYSQLRMSNPLEIDLILEIFFSFCSASDLKNCRLVCKKWRDLSIRAWRDKAILLLDKKANFGQPGLLSRSSVLKDYLSDLITHERSGTIIPDVTNDHLQLGKYPFRNFGILRNISGYSQPNMKPITDIARQVILYNVTGARNDFAKFLSVFQTVEDLELKNCELTWEGTTLPLSRNLKRLRIYQDVNGSDSQKKFTFDSFPHLKTLSIEYRRLTSCSENARNIMKCIKRSANNGVAPLRLKELEIINTSPTFSRGIYSRDWIQEFDEELLKILVECEFPLEKLALDLTISDQMDMNGAIRSLHPLLDSCRDTIRYLRTAFYFDMDQFFEFLLLHQQQKDWEMKIKRALQPVSNIRITLDKLKEMKLANGLWGLYLMAHLHLPNLEKLVVEYGRYTKKLNVQHYQVQLLKEKVYGKLETFELLDCYQIPEPDTISLFRDMMPNLVYLSVPLDKQAFRMVCQKFTGLRTLNVLSAECRYAKLDDDSLTGLSNDKKEGGRRPPNITDLTLLTDLIISSDVAFTEQAVIHGFLQLPKLHFLSVAFKKISDEVKESLLRHVKGSVQIQKEQSLNLVYSESDRDKESEKNSCSESESSEQSAMSSEEDSEEDSESASE